jgi:hypothetical protein
VAVSAPVAAPVRICRIMDGMRMRPEKLILQQQYLLHAGYFITHYDATPNHRSIPLI